MSDSTSRVAWLSSSDSESPTCESDGGDCSSSSSSCVLDTRFPEYFGSDKLSWALRRADGLRLRGENGAGNWNKKWIP